MRRSPRLASKRAALSPAADGGGGGADGPPARRPGAAPEPSSSASSPAASPGPDQSPGKARYYRSVTPQKRSRHSGGAPGERSPRHHVAPDAAAADRETPPPAEQRNAPVPDDSPGPERPGSTASSAARLSAGPAPEEMPAGLIQITPRRPVPDIAARILSKSPSARSERRVSLAEKVMTRNTVLSIKNFVEAPEKPMPPPNKPEEPARGLQRLLAEREREPASTAPGNGDDADTGLGKLDAFERIDQENDPNAVARKERRQSRVTFAKMAHVRFFNKDASPSPREPRRSSKIGLQSPGRSPSLSFLRDNKGIGFEMPDLGSTGSALDNPFDLRLSLEGSQEGNESESDMNDVSMELSSCDGGIRTPVLNPRPLSSIEGELESPQLDDAMDETRPVGGIRAISDPLAQDHTDNISGLIDFGRPAVQSPSVSGRESISARCPPTPNFATAADDGRRDSLANQFSQSDCEATGRFSLGDCDAMDETVCIGGIRLSSIGCGGARRLSSTGNEAAEEALPERGIRRSSVGRGAAHRLSLASTSAIRETRCVEGARRSSVGANAAADDTFSCIFEGDDVFSPQPPGRSSVASSGVDREFRSSHLPSRTPPIGLDLDDRSSQLPSCPPPVDLDREGLSSRLPSRTVCLDHEVQSYQLTSHTPSVGLGPENRSSPLLSCAPPVDLNREDRSTLLPSSALSNSLDSEDRPSQLPSHALSVSLDHEDRSARLPSSVSLAHEDRFSQLPSRTPSVDLDCEDRSPQPSSENRSSQLPSRTPSVDLDCEDRSPQPFSEDRPSRLPSRTPSVDLDREDWSPQLASEDRSSQLPSRTPPVGVDREGQSSQLPSHPLSVSLDHENKFSQPPSPAPSVRLDHESRSLQLPAEDISSQPPPRMPSVGPDRKDLSFQLPSRTLSVGLDHEGRSFQLPSHVPCISPDHENRSIQLPSCPPSNGMDHEDRAFQLPSCTPSVGVPLGHQGRSSQLPPCTLPISLHREDRSSQLPSGTHPVGRHLGDRLSLVPMCTPSDGLDYEDRSSQLPSGTQSVGRHLGDRLSLVPSCTPSDGLDYEDRSSQLPSGTQSVGRHLGDRLSLVPSCTPSDGLDYEDQSFQLSSRTSSIGVVASPMAEQSVARKKDNTWSTTADRRMSTGTARRRERAIAPAEMRRHTLAGGGLSSLASGKASHAGDEMHAAAQDVSLIAASSSAVMTCELESLKLDEILVEGLDERIDHETTEQDNGAKDMYDGEIQCSNVSSASAVNDVVQDEVLQNEDNPKDLNEQNDAAFDDLANKMEALQDNRTGSPSNTSAEASRACAVNDVTRAELEALKQDEVWLMNLDEQTDHVYKSLTNTTNEGLAEISNQDKRSKDISDRSAKAAHARKEITSQIREFRGKIERLKQERAELEVKKQKLEVKLAEKRELEKAARIARAKQDEEARAYNEKRDNLVHLAEVDLCGDDVLSAWKRVWLDGLVMHLECRGRVRAEVDLSKDQRTILVKVVDQSDSIAAWVINGEGCCDLGENAGENGVKLDRAVEVLRRVGDRLQSAERVESDVRRVCRRHQAEIRVCGDALVSEICFVGMVIEAKLLLQLWLSPEGCWGYDQKLCYGDVSLFDLTKVLHGCGTPGVLSVAEAVNKWWEEIDRHFPR